MPMNRALLTLCALGLFALPPLAHAQSCHVSGAFGMNFGTVTGSGRAATSALTYTCSPDYSGSNRTFHYQLCVHIGPGDWSAGQATRRMTNYNGSYLNYDLFSDPAHTQLIGAPGSTPVYQVFSAVPPGAALTSQATIHGWVYPGQSVPAVSGYQEQGLHGQLRYRYGATAFPNSADCTTGGDGGGSVTFDSSGVLASYDNGCWIVATDLNFGQASPPQAPIRGTSTIRIQCAASTTWKVGLDNGQHFDGSMRRMAGPGGHVSYQLYLDESRTRVWGNDDTSMATGTTDSSGTTVSLTVHGEVPPQPDAAEGSYADTIVVTLYH